MTKRKWSHKLGCWLYPVQKDGKTVWVTIPDSSSDDRCEACQKEAANQECAHGILCDDCYEQVHGKVDAECEAA